MSRKARLLFNNFSYHIIARGNQRQKAFCDNEDFTRFLDVLSKYKRKFPTKIYAYCVMSNHFHLLIDPEDKSLLKNFMHGINMSYAKYFNHKYNKSGHLWQGRFKSFIISKDSYMLNCINYIEYNPIRANIVDKPEDYPWSSYKARILGEQDRLLDLVTAVNSNGGHL